MSIQGLETAAAAPRTELEAARAQIESLHLALETRTAIGIAVGTLMVERTLTDTMAFAYLVELSTQRGTKIRDIAPTMVDQANQSVARVPTQANRASRGAQPGEAPMKENPRAEIDASSELVELSAVHAAMVSDHAHKVAQLEQGMASRKVIGQAIGLIMFEYQLNESAALEALRLKSSFANAKLGDVASELVAAANMAGSS
jgi:AmiR/NasT family two-component response regulator